MEIFLDSADPREITDAAQIHLIDGATTTPTMMKAAGTTEADLAQVCFPIHVEVLGGSPLDIAAKARQKADLFRSGIFKIPANMDGIRACHLLEPTVRVNLHLIYTLRQMLLAMRVSATYVCVLAGRGEDQGYDPLELIRQSVAMKMRYGFKSKIMFSSVRSLEHVRQAIILGADAITVPPAILAAMAQNDLTENGIKKFVADSK